MLQTWALTHVIVSRVAMEQRVSINLVGTLVTVLQVTMAQCAKPVSVKTFVLIIFLYNLRFVVYIYELKM